MANDNQSLISRAWRALRAFEEGLDYSGQDYLFDRLAALEGEVASIKAQLDDEKARNRNAA